MISLLLVIIYLAFISLGLPDSLLGAAWPVMRVELDLPVSYAGIITMIISGGTILSSLVSDRMTKKLGTGIVTSISVLMTAGALFGFSVSNHMIMLCIFAVPYGLGAGAIDAALNNYVALHFSSRHMNWLHCFWGIGAAVSPYIMSFALSSGAGWNNGYRYVSYIQLILSIILFASLPLWKNRRLAESEMAEKKPLGLIGTLKIDGVVFVLLIFFGYCAMESTAGLWASSYLAQYRGVDTETAAMFASLFYLGITFGRFLCGFVSDKIGDRRMIRIGVLTLTAGIIVIGLPVKEAWIAEAGLILTGLGCAPIYPSIIHSTPDNFGKENSQAIIGIQMASAYVGSTFMPPLFGLISQYISIGLYPLFLLIFALLMLITSEWMKKRKKAKSAELK